MPNTTDGVDVTRGPIARQLCALSLPIFFSSFCQQTYALINTYIVGLALAQRRSVIFKPFAK